MKSLRDENQNAFHRNIYFPLENKIPQLQKLLKYQCLQLFLNNVFQTTGYNPLMPMASFF